MRVHASARSYYIYTCIKKSMYVLKNYYCIISRTFVYMYNNTIGTLTRCRTREINKHVIVSRIKGVVKRRLLIIICRKSYYWASASAVGF